ncbi:T9SS type A sorting domain-containing protein [Bacteroides sp.]
MNWKIFFLFLLTVGIRVEANAQSQIRIPFTQNPPLVISTESVNVTMPEGGLELGAELIIEGGDGMYAYNWTLNNESVGTESTLFVNKYGTYYLEITDGEGCKRSVKFSVADPTGIKAEQASLLSVYPVLTEGEVNIKSSLDVPLEQVSVISMDGRLVRVYNVSSLEQTGGGIFRINLTGLSAGRYLLVCTLKNQLITKTVVLL